jgi:hypothetical protein
MSQEGLNPSVGVGVFIFKDDKFIDQAWVDFDHLPETLFLSWQQLLKSEFIEPLGAYAAS